MATFRLMRPVQWFMRAFADAKLDSKLAVILTVAGMIGFGTLFIALTAIISPSFSLLESQSVARHIERTRAALDEYSVRVETAVRDYAAWDDSYDYIIKPNLKFEADTLSVLAMTNLDINGMAYVKFDGSIAISRWVDITAQVEQPELTAIFSSHLRKLAAEPTLKSTESIRYYARIGDRVAAISAARVVKTDGSGTPIGFVAMAREISNNQLTELLQSDARLILVARKPAALISMQPEAVKIAVDILGLHRERIGQAQFSIDRSLVALGRDTLILSVACSAVVLMFVLFGMRTLMQRVVIAPMNSVERHMQHLSLSGELRPLDRVYANDEIGSLVQNLNAMLNQQKDMREQLEIQSFQLGRTESAVGVMHNVRNGLNPISVILSRALSDAPAAPEADVERALAEVANPQTDAVRRERLTQFLRLALTAQATQFKKRNAEMETARECIQNVVSLIGEQQESAHHHVETEPVDVTSIVEQNAALAKYSAAGDIRFAVEQNGPVATANRILLSQVIGNIFSNAVEAIIAAERIAGLIEVRFDEDANQVLIQIRDNGHGFAPEMSVKLFERGFSTRRQKSGGLGLHWCSNALAMMSGRLTMESDGPGLGATATITLPKFQTPVASEQHPRLADKAEPGPARGSFAEHQPLEIQNHR
jgi:signal transduction histidine kinase